MDEEPGTGKPSAEAHLAAIVDSSRDPIISKTLDGIVRSWNRAAEELFGYTAAEIVGRPLTLIFPPDRIAEEGEILKQLRAGVRVDHFDTVRRRKDGTDIPVSLTVSPIYDAMGRIVGASKIIRDITELRDRERKLEEARAELAHFARVSELGQMVSALAHEVSQPLTAIGNFLTAAQQLNANGAADRVGNVLGAASVQTRRASEIVQRLRDFVVKGETEKRPEDLSATLQEASALALLGHRNLGVTVEMRLHSEAVSVVIDRVQVQQVLFNLIRNAVEAMTHSTRRVLTIRTEPLDNGMVEICVTDTGAGLASEVREKLFQPFVTTKASGMGVGLSICRTIVEAHGGRLVANDNPEGGTVFCFTVPKATTIQE